MAKEIFAMSDIWLKIVQFLGALNGENVKRESYVRTPENEGLKWKLCTIAQKSILSGKTHIQTRKLPVLSRKLAGSFRDNIRVSMFVYGKSVKSEW